MNGLLAYLLTGFFLHFLSVQLLDAKPKNGFWFELAATILWPVPVLAGIFSATKKFRA